MQVGRYVQLHPLRGVRVRRALMGSATFGFYAKRKKLLLTDSVAICGYQLS